MSYSIHGCLYNTRRDALTALCAAYVSADGENSIDDIKSALNDYRETAEQMARDLSLDMGAGEELASADELAEHMQCNKADIIMAT